MSVTQQLINDLRAKRPRVLIIEDDANDVFLMTRAAEKMGCSVDAATSAEEAIAKLFKSKLPNTADYNIIFLDLKLPGKSGVDVLREIRLVAPELQVVVVTGMAGSPMVEEAAALGYIGLVQKPLTEENISEILTKHKLFVKT